MYTIKYSMVERDGEEEGGGRREESAMDGIGHHGCSLAGWLGWVLVSYPIVNQKHNSV